MGGIESLIILPAGFVSISFGSMVETALVWINSRKLAELLPGPIGVIVAELLDIAVSLSDIQSTDSRVSHGNTGRQERNCPKSRRDHLSRCQVAKT